MTEETTNVQSNEYLASGMHIGTQFKLKDMDKYIFKRREDGLYVLDIQKIKERISITAKFLAKYEPSKVVIVASRAYAQHPAAKMAEVCGFIPMTKRFYPGTFTNTKQPTFMEPEVIFVADPVADHQAVAEGLLLGKPVVGICDSNTPTGMIDVVIPSNNKGKKALSFLFYELAKEIFKIRNGVGDEALGFNPNDFVGKPVKVFKSAPEKKPMPRRFSRDKGR